MNSKLPKAATASLKRTAALKNYSVISLFLLPASVFAQQAVTGIITDFNSYWRSSASSINPVKPNNSHNLLAFTYNGVQYSTGVNNGVLSGNGQTFVDGDFWSLPLANYSGSVNSNTKVGLGEMYDGVHNGKGPINYSNNIATYLNDGIKGLDIGTCVANLPAGNITFLVNNLRPANIGDGIPDIIVTQVADPSNSVDKYSFIDGSGNVIGQIKEVNFTSIAPIGNWTADFYEASTNPMVLTTGFTNTDRPLRLWAADLSDFGITQANYAGISNFKIALSGSSDVAFVAYNNKTMSISNVLPFVLSDFTARESGGKALLNWATANEKGAAYFVVERSTDGVSFKAIDTVNASGNNTTAAFYSSQDALQAGTNYYRLKMVDLDIHSTYSKVVQLSVKEPIGVRVFPNPAVAKITISYPSSSAGNISVYNANGVLMQQKRTDRNSIQANIDVSSYTKGMYYLVIENEHEKITKSFVVK